MLQTQSRAGTTTVGKPAAERILDAALEHQPNPDGSGRVVVPAAGRFARDPGEFTVGPPGGTS